MLEDVVTIVDIEQNLTGREVQVGGFDLIWQNGPVRVDRPASATTFLGAHRIYNSTTVASHLTPADTHLTPADTHLTPARQCMISGCNNNRDKQLKALKRQLAAIRTGGEGVVGNGGTGK